MPNDLDDGPVISQVDLKDKKVISEDVLNDDLLISTDDHTLLIVTSLGNLKNKKRSVL